MRLNAQNAHPAVDTPLQPPNTDVVQSNAPAGDGADLLAALKNLIPILQGIIACKDDQAANTQFRDDFNQTIKDVQDTYHVVLKMQTQLPAQIDRQQPVLFLDACGYLAPFHLEFITSWEAFVAVLTVKFKQRGLRLVERKQYVLEDVRRKRLINQAHSWETCFFPGQQVNMDAWFYEKPDSGTCCPVCQHMDDVAVNKGVDW